MSYKNTSMNPAIRSSKAQIHYVASRGEALNGHIVATLLDAEYIDAAEVIRFAPGRRLDPVTYDLIRERLSGDHRYVILASTAQMPMVRFKLFPAADQM